EEVIDDNGEVIKRKKKKGLLGKIMDKLPGYHKTGEEDKAAAATGEHKPSA
uniref:Dehydrin n=1 Tax=Aegilops tauschii subsp. strangulata TaxID=200361 RepID=A0A453P8Y3_AEGTS